MQGLPESFPFHDIFESFLEEYSSTATYWYVPKVRVLNDENVQVTRQVVKLIFDEFLGHIWNQETQDKMLNRLIELEIVNPNKPDGTLADRTALIRIWKKLLETLGLLWIQNDTEIVITDAGLNLIASQAGEERFVVEQQIVKYQYPNPGLSAAYAESFDGLLPHIFLLQVLKECSHHITYIEYELFVNLAQSQDDINGVVQNIHSWRDLNEKEKEIVREIVQQIPMKEAGTQPELFADIRLEEEPTRFIRIHLNSSYQRPFFTFPSYVGLDGGDIICHEPDQVDELLSKMLPSLKVTEFRTIEDWFAYFGDPSKEPSWLTYLISFIEDASTPEEAQTVIEAHRNQLRPDEVEAVQKAQVEKSIETFYFAQTNLLESGLVVVKDGRQFSTPIGRIDLLCISREKQYVVVEIKADEARDSVFGQILRYIGWVNRNIEGAKNNVRGIILASQFPESARYSRIGLLKPDYKTFIKFKEHRLNVQDT